MAGLGRKEKTGMFSNRVYEITDRKQAAPLFAGWEETLIWCCLQGPMGYIYGDCSEKPVSAMALLGDFCFFAGKPCRELVQYKPQSCGQNSVIMVPRDEGWARVIEECFQGEGVADGGEISGSERFCGAGETFGSERFCAAGMNSWSEGHCEAEEISGNEILWGTGKNSGRGGLPQAKKVLRYAIRKEPDLFIGDIMERLRAAAEALPEGYELKMMDEELFWRCRGIPWCRDWVSQYADYRMYKACGLGAVILKDGDPVSGASSYSGHLGSRTEEAFWKAGYFERTGFTAEAAPAHFLAETPSIEIEIDTREDFRRKGLAFICGAKLILECCKKGWYPSWDAQNLWSVALAEKLGYHFDHAYTAYEISNW